MGRQHEGLEQEISEPVSFPKPALGCAGSCARASLITLYAFVKSSEKQSACITSVTLHSSVHPVGWIAPFPDLSSSIA